MRRAILFRHHKNPGICRDRIEFLRRLNPQTPIYGMYGGAQPVPPFLPFDHNYALPFESARYKWLHGDLCMRQWFIDCGYRFRFDMLHIVEWDLVYLKPLAEIFAKLTSGVGFTHVENLAVRRASNWDWIMTQEGNAELKQLRAYVRKTYNRNFTDANQLACVFPGASFSRVFLERYAREDIPALMHDEIRAPLYAQIYGLPITPTHFEGNFKYWNCHRHYVPAALVYAAQGKRCAFHPVRDQIDLGKIFNPAAIR